MFLFLFLSTHGPWKLPVRMPPPWSSELNPRLQPSQDVRAKGQRHRRRGRHLGRGKKRGRRGPERHEMDCSFVYHSRSVWPGNHFQLHSSTVVFLAIYFFRVCLCRHGTNSFKWEKWLMRSTEFWVLRGTTNCSPCRSEAWRFVRVFKWLKVARCTNEEVTCLSVSV